MISASAVNAQKNEGWLSRALVGRITPAAVILLGIVALSAFLYVYQLDAIGDANLYYTAAVESMLDSWHNFFFVAAEPGGSVTVDKPPLGLWVQAASAFLFGVNGVAVVLPNILAGLLSIPLVYHLTKKYFGTGAGLVAALVVAVTPVGVAAARNNTADGLLTFVLVLAAWAFLKATETDKARYLWLGAVLVGLGFNIKMLQAFLPLPAFYAAYFLGARAGWGRKIANLAGATAILLVVSLSWAVAVDLVPAEQRPYVGSSSDNTMMDLVVGYNGLNRLLGGEGGGGSLPAGQLPSPPATGDDARPGPPQDDGPFQPRPGDGTSGVGPPNGGPPAGQPGGAGGPGGSDEVGDAGILRFFTAPLSNEMSWLLPFALLMGLFILFRHRLRLPLAREHQMLVLWGGWLLTGLVFFSVAGFFHAYYLVMLAPPLGVLVGGGAAAAWNARRTAPQVAALLLVGAVVVTVAFQWFAVGQYVGDAAWLPLTSVLLLAGGGLAFWSWEEGGPVRWQRVALALLLAAMLVTPLAWSVLTTTTATHAALPGAYEGETGQRGPAGENIRSVDDDLLAFLQANTQDTDYLLAVPSSMQGAQYVLATGRPVLYMGGFNGSDPVVDAQELAQMVAAGELRYVMIERGGRGTQQAIAEWVQGACATVAGVGTTSPRPGPGGNTGLYECSPVASNQ